MEDEPSKDDDFDDEKYNASINSDGHGEDLAEEIHHHQSCQTMSSQEKKDRRERSGEEKKEKSLARAGTMLYQSSGETLHLPSQRNIQYSIQEYKPLMPDEETDMYKDDQT